MTTDTTERGLEELIVRSMTGRTDVLVPAHVATETSVPVAGGTGWLLGDAGALRPRVLRRPRPAARLPAGNPGRPPASPCSWTGRPDAAQVPGAAAGRDHQARHDRRAAPRHQARPAPPRPLLRHALARQREGGRALRAQPLQRHAAAPLQPRRDAAGARPGAVHQRPADRHLRAEEQPDQADRRGRRRAVPARPRPAREALRVRPLRRPLRRGRARGALLHAPEGQGLVVPAVQPGLERRRRQPAEPRRPQDRLPLEAHPHPRRA